MRKIACLTVVAYLLACLSCDAFVSSLYGGARLAAGGSAALSLTPASGAPGMIIQMKSGKMTGPISNYTVKFGTGFAPIMGVGDAAGTFRLMVPWVEPGKASVQILSADSDAPLEKATFTVAAAAATGIAPGEAAGTVVADVKANIALVKDQVAPGLVAAGFLDAQDEAPLKAELDRAQSFFDTAKTIIDALPADEKAALDQMLCQADILKASAKSVQAMRGLVATSRAASSADYSKFYRLVALDGFSAIITSIKSGISLVGLMLGIVPGFSAGVSASCGVMVFAFDIFDKWLDNLTPTDLVELSMKKAKPEDAEIFIPYSGSKRVNFEAKFQTQSTPIDETVDYLVGKMTGALGGKATFNLGEEELDASGAAGVLLDRLKDYIPKSTLVSQLSEGWKSALETTVPADPEYYSRGLPAFEEVMLKELNVSWTPGFFRTVPASDFSMKDPAICSYKAAGSVAKGLKEGESTQMNIGAYCFAPLEGSGSFALETASPLESEALKTFPVTVKKTAEISPETGLQDVEPDSDFVITQLMPVNPSCTSTAALTLDCTSGTPVTLSAVTCDVSVEDNSITFVQRGELESEASYSNARISGVVLVDEDGTDLPLEPYSRAEYSIKTVKSEYGISFDWTIAGGSTGFVQAKNGRSGSAEAKPAGFLNQSADGKIISMDMLAFTGTGEMPYVELAFYGKEPGSYGNDATFMTYKATISTYWTAYMKEPSGKSRLTVVVTKVGAVGSSVQGTFSGILASALEGVGDMTVSNGKFTIKRIDHDVWH